MAKRSFLISALVALTFGSALAQQATQQANQQASIRKPEILVLGCYHMANPGRDLFNMKADDVLAPKRQAEITELIEVLKKFQPTKVAIESDAHGPRLGQYADYLAGKRTLTSNEIEQLGFRLAKEMGHKTIYPVDVDGDFPWPRVVNYAKGSGRAKELDAIMSEIGTMVKAQDKFLASHTVLETLVYMNADAKVAEDMGFYFREAHLGEPGDWAGADLVSDWFRRNMRIYSNLTRLVDSPNERILVIYGNGHLGWLRHNVESDSTLRLRRLADFVK